MKNKQIHNTMNRLKQWILLPLLLLSAAGMQAQQPVELTLKSALNYALQANQEARKAKLDLENSEYQIDEVRARALPQINGTASVTHNPLLQKSALPNIFGPNPNPNESVLIALGQKWNANAGVSLSQAIFDKSVLTGLDAAKATREFYRLSSQLTEEQVIEQVATNYYQVLVQRQQLAVLDSTIKNSREVQSILRGQYENGLAKKIDLDRMAVNISNLNSQRQQLLNSVALLENQLKFYMGMPIQTPVIIPDAEINAIQPKAVALTESIDPTIRTEYRLLEGQENLLRYQKEAYKSEYYPSLSLSSNYSYQGMGNKMPVFKGQNQGVNWFGTASVSLNLRIPIFNGFATRSRVKQAEISIKKLNEDMANTSLALNLAFENAKTQINNSIITLNAQKENVRLAQEVFENTQNNYNNGLATLTDLLNAETSLTEANNNYSSALLNYRVAEIQLIKSQGQLKGLVGL
ncbi:MAG TPA: TolC family protein [Chitinophagaceae bacterium]|nr:TolC family protein [Chitinophagaceae bacterium]